MSPGNADNGILAKNSKALGMQRARSHMVRAMHAKRAYVTHQISRADIRVKVTANIFFGSSPVSRRRVMRRLIAYDLPVPGPARTRILADVSAAIR
jgi:hypothetical protein